MATDEERERCRIPLSSPAKTTSRGKTAAHSTPPREQNRKPRLPTSEGTAPQESEETQGAPRPRR